MIRVELLVIQAHLFACFGFLKTVFFELGFDFKGGQGSGLPFSSRATRVK